MDLPIDPTSAREVEAMARRLTRYKTLVRSCPHRDGWRLFARFAQCCSCGFVVDQGDASKHERWTEPSEQPSEALGLALVQWECPR